MVRGLILLALVSMVTFLARPFVMTSRALDEHGITIPGSVYHKSEWVKVLLQGFPGRTDAPAREVRQASGRVTSVGRIDKLFSGSRSRGMLADQPIEVVGVEFVPEGRTEPVVAVDAIDRGSIAALREKAVVTLHYEANSPRTAYIDGASRQFPERNIEGVVKGSVLYVVVFAALLGAVHWLGRGYKRLVSRSR